MKFLKNWELWEKRQEEELLISFRKRKQQRKPPLRARVLALARTRPARARRKGR